MTIDTIKISQEINFNGLPTWISIGGTLLPDDDVKEGLKAIQQVITDYDNEAKKEFSKSKWGRNNPYADAEAKPMMDMIVLRQYEKAVKENDTKTIENIKSQYHVED